MDPESTRPAARRLGRYRLERRLGKGGMGEVWEASLMGPGGFRRKVALKLLAADLREASARDGLIREARLGGLLAHPNVAATYELGEAAGEWFVAMELVDGPTLADLMKSGPVPARSIVEMGIQASAALHHVHSLSVAGVPAGLVHRDVKLTNLMLDRHGLVKLVDLGIAEAKGKTGASAGTPGYMPAEQSAGEADSRSDLFALGVVLYILSARKRPFGNGVRAVITAAKSDALLADPAFLEVVGARVPGLDRVLGRCLRQEPGDRWATARDLQHALSELLPAQDPAPALAELVGGDRLAGRSLYRPPTSGSGSFPRRSTAETRVLDNLPRSLGSFVGRAAQVARIDAAVRGPARLVTVTGLGGMGKTRTTLEALRQLVGTMDGGVWFADLAEARTVDGVCAAVGSALGVALLEGDAVQVLGAAIAGRGRCVLMLDNFEQVGALAPDTVGRWLDAAPDASFVVTSRVRLPLDGGLQIALRPMGAKDTVALLRARANRSFSEEDEAALTPLAARLEGLPLAVELAAARCRLMGPRAILARLDQRFRVLSGGSASAPKRHRSLEASIHGSWELLEPAVQAALAQLSVFAGSWTLQAAEAVLDLSDQPGDPWALDVLQALVDHSLVSFDPERERFGMLVSIQAFAERQLSPQARLAAERRHGEWYAQMGTPEALAAVRLRGGQGRLDALKLELDNLVAACGRATELGAWAVASGCALAASQVLMVMGPLSADQEQLARVLKGERDPGRRGALLLRLAMASTTASDTADDLLGEAIGCFREAGDRAREGEAHSTWARRIAEAGRHREAVELGRKGLALIRSSGDRGPEPEAMLHLGFALWHSGEAEEARGLTHAAHDLAVQVGCRRAVPMAIVQLGNWEHREGEWLSAAHLYKQASQRYAQLGDRSGQCVCLMNLGGLAASQGMIEEASAWLEEALVLVRQLGQRDVEAGILLNSAFGLLQAERGREAVALLEQSVAIAQTIPNHAMELTGLILLCDATTHLGDLDAAWALSERTVALARSLDDPGRLLQAQGSQGEVLMRRGEVDRALEIFEQGEATARALGLRLELGQSLNRQAVARERLGDRDGAHALAVAVLAVMDELGMAADAGPRRQAEELRDRMA